MMMYTKTIGHNYERCQGNMVDKGEIIKMNKGLEHSAPQATTMQLDCTVSCKPCQFASLLYDLDSVLKHSTFYFRSILMSST